MCLQYGISVLIAQTSFQGETICGIAKCRLFSQAIQSLHFFGKIEILNLSSLTVGMKLQCINAAINPKIQYDGTANSHAQPILVSVSFLFLRYLTTKHSILRNTEKRPDTDYTRGDYWGNFNYCNHIAIGHMDIATELQY